MFVSCDACLGLDTFLASRESDGDEDEFAFRLPPGVDAVELLEIGENVSKNHSIHLYPNQLLGKISYVVCIQRRISEKSE